MDRRLRLLRRHPPGPGDLAVKLIAEPWDLGQGGEAGRQFPGGDRSGNGETATPSAGPGRATRDRSRELAYRLTGSSHLYGWPADGRRDASTSSPPTTASPSPTWSRHETKHNLANGEDNRDGTDDNSSWNCGVEGPTADPKIVAPRQRQMRNFLATLFLSLQVSPSDPD